MRILPLVVLAAAGQVPSATSVARWDISLAVARPMVEDIAETEALVGLHLDPRHG